MGTIEIRCHEGTVNKTKAINWFVISLCLLKYAENIKDVFACKELKLKDILDKCLSTEQSEYLQSYLISRKENFFSGNSYKDNITRIDNKWFRDDNNYKFNKKGKFV